MTYYMMGWFVIFVFIGVGAFIGAIVTHWKLNRAKEYDGDLFVDTTDEDMPYRLKLYFETMEEIENHRELRIKVYFLRSIDNEKRE